MRRAGTIAAPAWLVPACLVLTSASCTDLGGLSVKEDLDGGAPVRDADATGTDAGPSPDAGADAGRYASEVLADGPIAYWRLGEGIAPVAKDVVGGHDGLYAGGLTLAAPGAIAGDPDTAVAFSDTSHVVEVTLPSKFEFAGKAAFAIELWAKRAGPGAAFLGKTTFDPTTQAYGGWQVVTNTEGTTASFYRGDKGIGAPLAPPPDSSFHHVVGTYDGVTMLLFIDGVQVASAVMSDALDPTPNAPLRLGRSESWGRLVGVLDEVAVYDKPLPALRVQAHYRAGRGL